MANQLALANISGIAAPVAPNYAILGGVDRNAAIVYEREKRVRYSVTLSGSYVQHVRGSNVGEVLDLTKGLSPSFDFANQFWGMRGPVRMYVLNPGGTGYQMTIVPGADSLHWLLAIYSGVATELAAGTYAANAAGLLTDLDIVVEATGVSAD